MVEVFVVTSSRQSNLCAASVAATPQSVAKNQAIDLGFK